MKLSHLSNVIAGLVTCSAGVLAISSDTPVYGPKGPSPVHLKTIREFLKKRSLDPKSDLKSEPVSAKLSPLPTGNTGDGAQCEYYEKDENGVVYNDDGTPKCFTDCPEGFLYANGGRLITDVYGNPKCSVPFDQQDCHFYQFDANGLVFDENGQPKCSDCFYFAYYEDYSIQYDEYGSALCAPICAIYERDDQGNVLLDDAEWPICGCIDYVLDDNGNKIIDWWGQPACKCSWYEYDGAWNIVYDDYNQPICEYQCYYYAYDDDGNILYVCAY